MTEEALAGQSLERLLETMAGPPSGPAAGTAAATAAALASALVAKTARRSRRQFTGADAVASRADELTGRAVQLGQDDADAVADMLGRRGAAGDKKDGPSERPASAPDPVETPQAIRRLATEVADLARQMTEQGNPRLHADALTAGHLAEAAVAGCDAIRASNQS